VEEDEAEQGEGGKAQPGEERQLGAPETRPPLRLRPLPRPRAAGALDFLLFMGFFPKLVSGPIRVTSLSRLKSVAPRKPVTR
jgi:hypothetical protein